MSNHRYQIVIYWSNTDQCFVVLVPELPGCMTDGSTYEEALQNAYDAIDTWIEGAKEDGMSIPEPKGRLVAVS
jgi:predicted RNase H-like HicB family nuclease